VLADFTKKEDIDFVLALAKEADVVIENYKVGDLKNYGLDYESVKKINPKIIYCSVTGFGQDGPYASRAPVTISSFRPWAASWTSPASRTASPCAPALPMSMSSPAAIQRSEFRRR
jgi:hypothetical protein